MREVVEAAGAQWRPFRYPQRPDLSGLPQALDELAVAEVVPEGIPEEEYSDFPSGILYWTEQMLPALVEDLQALAPAPAVLVYEPFLAAGRVAAKAMGIPAVGLFTMPGPGVFTMPSEKLEAHPWVDKPRRAIAERYGVDVLEDGMIMESYSPVVNIVTTIDALFAPPRTEQQIRRFGHFPFACVGVLMDTKVKRVSQSPGSGLAAGPAAAGRPGAGHDLGAALPTELLQEAQQAGRKVIFVSLGTVATNNAFWGKPFANFAPEEEGGRRPLSDITGKEFCQRVWRICFDALGGDNAFLVVLSLGPKEDVLEGLPPVPDNFVVRSIVPQLEMLRLSDAMVTHGGANSMHEALGFGVPLAVVPIFGDQPANADTVARSGAGVSFRDPMRTLSAASLRRAVAGLAAPGAGNSKRLAAQAVQQQLAAAGGVPAAADIVLKHAVAHHGPGAPEVGGA
uniref:Erythromycin biosynthesis protein CIII-like C-terminal domain-containing protein n=1 Tax=Zooxanthella nutricula TaxID=1333877 RepID=A0A7S2I605_9DINO